MGRGQRVIDVIDREDSWHLRDLGALEALDLNTRVGVGMGGPHSDLDALPRVKYKLPTSYEKQSSRKFFQPIKVCHMIL